LSYESYFFLLFIVCLYVSVVDFLHRKIHNLTLFILLVFQCFLSPIDIQIASFFLILGIGLILYSQNWIGAGDIKYAAVLSLTIVPNDLLWSFVMTAYAGGFLAVMYLLGQKLPINVSNTQEGIPYGIAISIGFYLIILTQNTPHI